MADLIRRGAQIGLVALATAGAWSCAGKVSGGSDEGSNEGSSGEPSHFDTGIPESQPINDLSRADTEKLCEARLDLSLDLLDDPVILDGTCAMVALEKGIDCDRFVDECAQAVSDKIDRSATLDKCIERFRHDGPLARCDATVGEFERCMSAEVDATKRIVGRIDCRSSPDEAEQAHADLDDLPDACRRLNPACTQSESEQRAEADAAPPPQPSCCDDPDDHCGFGNDGVCNCPGATWDRYDCAAPHMPPPPPPPQDDARGVCDPDYCPAWGPDPACCVTPYGPCGTNAGMGCVKNEPKEEDAGGVCNPDYCPAWGPDPACCVTPYGPCGTNAGMGCVKNEPCNPAFCPAPAFGTPCCIAGDGPCGTDVGKGCQLEGTALDAG